MVKSFLHGARLPRGAAKPVRDETLPAYFLRGPYRNSRANSGFRLLHFSALPS
jgi:hypothetical protein